MKKVLCQLAFSVSVIGAIVLLHWFSEVQRQETEKRRISALPKTVAATEATYDVTRLDTGKTKRESVTVLVGRITPLREALIEVSAKDGSDKETWSYDPTVNGSEWQLILSPARKGQILVKVSWPGYLGEVRCIEVGRPVADEDWRIYPGDLDGNGVIDARDVSIVTHFARPAISTKERFAKELTLPNSLRGIDDLTCDFDGNGIVDISDINVVASNLGRKERRFSVGKQP